MQSEGMKFQTDKSKAGVFEKGVNSIGVHVGFRSSEEKRIQAQFYSQMIYLSGGDLAV